MSILYLAIGAFLIGGGIIILTNFLSEYPTKHQNVPSE